MSSIAAGPDAPEPDAAATPAAAAPARRAWSGRIGGLVGLAIATFEAVSRAGWSSPAIAAACLVLLLAAMALVSLRAERRSRFWTPFALAAAGALGLTVWSATAGTRPVDPEAFARDVERRITTTDPSLAVVATHEAAAWADLHQKLVAFARAHPNEQENAAALAILEILAPLQVLIKKGAVRGSDAAVVTIFRTKLTILQAMQAAGPEICKSFVNLDVKALAALPPDLRTQLKASDRPLSDAYVDGVDKPMPRLLTEAQADAALVRMQKLVGVNLSNDDFGLLGGTGPAPQVCDAMIRFSQVLVQGPERDSAAVIRFLLMQ